MVRGDIIVLKKGSRVGAISRAGLRAGTYVTNRDLIGVIIEVEPDAKVFHPAIGVVWLDPLGN
jgi:hypothetical protein